MATIVESDPKASFSIAITQRCKEGSTPFPGLPHFTLDSYLIMLSVKQGSIKYHFLSLWYDSTWDWTQISRVIGEHSNHYANVKIVKQKWKEKQQNWIWLHSEKLKREMTCPNQRIKSKFFGIVPMAPIIIGITVTILHNYFSSPSRSRYLSNILHYFLFAR